MSELILPSELALVEPWNIADLMTRSLPTAPCWIEPAVLPKGGKLLFGGHAKIGKSFVMMELARALATGSRPMGCPHLSVTRPTRVGILEQEIGPWGIQKRAQVIMAGENLDLLRSNFHGISQLRGFRLEVPGAVDYLVDFCLQREIEVLFLDPIGKMHGYDENDAGQIARLFGKIEEILSKCSKNQMSIVISHHFGKPSRDPRIEQTDEQLFSPYNFRGSTKWYDDPDTLVTCNRMPGENATHKWWYVKTRWECRQGEGPPEWMTFSINRNRNLRVLYEENAMQLSKRNTRDVGPPLKLKLTQGRPFKLL